MADTFDLTGGAACIPLDAAGKVFLLKNTVTMPECVSTDILQVLPIPAKTLVLSTAFRMSTIAVGTTCTGTVGITGGTANGFDAAVDFKTAITSIVQGTPSDTYTAAGGHYAHTADTIDVVATISAVTTWPVFDVWALCLNLD